MANVFVREPESAQERLDLVAQLRAFPRDTLRYLLPVAPNGYDLLCDALGWHDAIPLAAALSRRQVDDEHLPDVLAVRQALEQAGDKIAKDMIGLFRGAHVHSERLPLFEAIARLESRPRRAGPAQAQPDVGARPRPSAPAARH